LKSKFTNAGCWTWALLFTVGAVFSWVFVFIRLTSDRVARIK